MTRSRFDNKFGMSEVVFDNAPISGERTSYSDPISIGGGGSFGLWLQITSALSVPRVRIFYEMSYDETLTHFVTPVNGADIVNNWSGEVPIVDSIAPTLMPFIRFGKQGLSGNPNDTLVTLVVFND
jgi:hypothetical protein